MKSVLCLLSFSSLILFARAEQQNVTSFDIIGAQPDPSNIEYVSDPEDDEADLVLPPLDVEPIDAIPQWHRWCPKKIYSICKKKEYVAVTLKKGSYEVGKRICSACGGKLIEINGDYQKFKKLVDDQTFIGCADAVMHNYLSGHKKETVSLRNVINTLIPKFVKRMIRKSTDFKSSADKFVLDDPNYELLKPIKQLLFKNGSNK